MTAPPPEASLAQLFEALCSADEPTRQAAGDELTKRSPSDVAVHAVIPSVACSRERIVMALVELHAQALDVLLPIVGARRRSRSAQRLSWHACVLERISRQLAVDAVELAPMLTARILALPSRDPRAGLAARLLVSLGEGARPEAARLMEILRRDGDDDGRVGGAYAAIDHVGVALGRLASTDAALRKELLAMLASGSRRAAGALGAAGPVARDAATLLYEWLRADPADDLERVLQAATALSEVAPQGTSWREALVGAWPVACEVAARGGADRRADMMGLLRRLGGDPRLVAIEAQWREQIQAERDTSTPPSPPRDERPADILCLDLVAPDEDVRARAALELEWRTIERVHELMDGGLPQERVRRQVLDETRRELHRLSPGVAARLVLLAAEHEDYCGWLPFTGHDAYVRCVGTAIKAWGSLAESARDALRSLETHESARLRTLAKEGLRAIRG